MAKAPFKIQRVAGALGAELLDIDLGRPCDAGTVAAIRQALLEHQVIFFREQRLEPGPYLDFARRFGEPMEYPMVRGIEGFPLIVEVAKLAHETVNFGGLWHSDTTYLERPPMGTLLLAREVPPRGGDTIFASQTLAYDRLSDGMKGLLDGLVAVNASTKAETTRTREDRIRDHDSASRRDFEAEHPAVRTHPETGRKALFVNGGHTVRFRGMSEEESAPILSYLYEHQVRPEFTCRFAWRPGSLAFWDNRAVQHNAINDYQGFKRVMHRITLAGDVPV